MKRTNKKRWQNGYFKVCDMIYLLFVLSCTLFLNYRRSHSCNSIDSTYKQASKPCFELLSFGLRPIDDTDLPMKSEV